MKEDFEIFEFNNRKYVLIEKYNLNNQEIYFFLADEDELFCTMQNKKYIPILDKEKIENIKETLGFIDIPVYFNPEAVPIILGEQLKILGNVMVPALLGTAVISMVKKIYINAKPVSEEDKEKIIKDQVEAIKVLEDKGINAQEFYDRIKNVKIREAETKKMPKRVRGFFHPGTNTIVYNKNLTRGNNISAKRVRLHEMIHKSTGRLYMMRKLIFNRGLLEGMTENAVSKVYGEKKSHIEIGKDKKSILRINLDKNTSYTKEVSIIRQMEYLSGKDSTKSIVYGDNDFINNFSEKYGKTLTNYIRGRCFISNLYKQLGLNKKRDEIADYKTTSDKILKVAFDNDYKKVETLDDAKEYMEKLRGFETVRGKVYFKTRADEKAKEDTFFKDYYENMHEKIKEKMLEKGYSKDEISELDEYSYKPQEFYPSADNKPLSKEEHKDALNSKIANRIAGMTEKEAEDYLNNLKICLYTKNGKTCSEIYVGEELDDTFYLMPIEEYHLDHSKDKIEDLKQTDQKEEYTLDSELKEKIKKEAKEIKEQLSQENDLKTITKFEPMMKIKAVASRMRRAIKQVLYKNKETQSGDVR